MLFKRKDAATQQPNVNNLLNIVQLHHDVTSSVEVTSNLNIINKKSKRRNQTEPESQFSSILPNKKIKLNTIASGDDSSRPLASNIEKTNAML